MSKAPFGQIGKIHPLGSTNQPPDSHLPDGPQHVPSPEVHEGRLHGDPRMERAPNQSVPETPRAKAHNQSGPTISRAQAQYGPVINTTPTASLSKTVLASPIQRGHVNTRVTSPPIMRETRTRRVLPHTKYADYVMN